MRRPSRKRDEFGAKMEAWRARQEAEALQAALQAQEQLKKQLAEESDTCTACHIII